MLVFLSKSSKPFIIFWPYVTWCGDVACLVFSCSILFPWWWNLGSPKTKLDKIAAFIVSGSLCNRLKVVVALTVPMPWCVGRDLFQGGDVSSAQQNTSNFYSQNLLKLIRSCQHEVWLDSWGGASSEVLAVRCGFDPVQPETVSSEKFTLCSALSPTNFLFFTGFGDILGNVRNAGCFRIQDQ